MVTIIAIVLGIFLLPVMIGNGEWGPAAVFVILILLVCGFCHAWSQDTKAYLNFRDYWAKGGPEKRDD